MAKAKRKGGLYIVGGKEVDAWGKPAKGAAKEEPRKEAAGTGDPLEGVPLASPEAEALARHEKLVAADFGGIDPSAQSGYSKDDVEAVVALKKDGK